MDRATIPLAHEAAADLQPLSRMHQRLPRVAAECRDEQALEAAAARQPPAEQSRREDARVVEDEHVARAQPRSSGPPRARRWSRRLRGPAPSGATCRAAPAGAARSGSRAGGNRTRRRACEKSRGPSGGGRRPYAGRHDRARRAGPPNAPGGHELHDAWPGSESRPYHPSSIACCDGCSRIVTGTRRRTSRATRQRSPMRIAITGASGLVGSALVPFLQGSGHDVIRLVRGTPRGPNEQPLEPGLWHRRLHAGARWTPSSTSPARAWPVVAGHRP